MGDLKDVFSSSVITKNILNNFQAILPELMTSQTGREG